MKTDLHQKLVKKSIIKNNKTGKKTLLGGLAEETLFALAHALRYFSDQITCLLTNKGFNYDLTGQSKNVPIEHLFSLNR